MFSPQKPVAARSAIHPNGWVHCQTGRREPPAFFQSAEQAWFWTMAELAARRDGVPHAPRSGILPEDVLRCLDGLYRQRRIDLLHARILRIWGERRRAPDPARRSEQGDAAIWREALGRLDWPLRAKGLVRAPTPADG